MNDAAVLQLPDDPALLKAVIAQRDTVIAEHEAALVGRQLQIERIKRESAAALAEREAQIEQIKREAADQIEAQRQRHRAEMDALLRRFYGPRNERFDLTQLLLFGREIDTIPIDIKAVEQEAGEKLVSRRARKRHNHGRGALPEHLPREVVNHDLKDAEKVDANGKPMVCIGYEVSEQLEYRPGGLFVLEHRRFKYAPADYQQSDTGAAIVVADKPPQPIEKGLAGPGLLAYIITSKLADHLPLYRLVRIIARDGVHVADSTMCGWILAVAELVTPLVLLMKQRVKQSKSIHTDETRVPVQAKGKCRTGRIWDWIGDVANPYIVFEFTPDRTNTWPIDWLKGYQGFLQADAGSSYAALYRLGKIIEVACWAHARRRFFDAKGTDALRSAQMLETVRQLYKVEDDAAKAIAAIKDATPQQADEIRLDLRQRNSVPVLEKIKAWLDEQAKLVLPRSPMAEAINYTLNQWDALCVYTKHGFLNIDNNPAERALKLIALGRKNWLFVQNDKFGKAYATLYSLIASAQRHGLDPQAYLRGVLAQIMTTPMSELDRFLPDVWKSRLEAEKAAGKATSPAGASPSANTAPATAPVSVPGPGP
jgi:transposase